MIKIKTLLIDLKSSFWFVPVVMVLLSMILASTLIEFDSRYSNELVKNWPRLFGAGPDASRGMLSTIASSIMSMMSVSFSMTLVTLALASSQYTSRILRNFMRSRMTQIILGNFAGIFTYCLIVLRTIRGTESLHYVPSLSIFIGFILAIIGVASLVIFIHHIASSIQATSIISNICKETVDVINSIYLIVDEEVPHNDCIPHKNFLNSVDSCQSGYIQSLDVNTVLELSVKLNCILKVNAGIGDFIIERSALVSTNHDRPLSEDMTKQLLGAFTIKRFRTIEQDPLFGIRQIVDVALKALSPGVNDTTTALICINYLTVILAKVGEKKMPSKYLFHNNSLRVILDVPEFNTFLDYSFDQIKNNAKNNIAIIETLITSFDKLLILTKEKDRKKCIYIHLNSMSFLIDSIEYAVTRDGLKKLLQELLLKHSSEIKTL